VLGAMLFAGCGTSREFRTGDLLFVGTPPASPDVTDGSMADAIVAATGSENSENFFHVAIIEVDPAGQVWVIDATTRRGVDRHPLDTLRKDFQLPDGTCPPFVVKRLRGHHPTDTYVANAKTFLGQPYDLYFLPDNNMQYCSELVYESYVRNGRHLFTAAPMNFKDADGNMPAYWSELFAHLGRPVPQGEPGTNPQDMSRSRNLRTINKK